MELRPAVATGAEGSLTAAFLPSLVLGGLGILDGLGSLGHPGACPRVRHGLQVLLFVVLTLPLRVNAVKLEALGQPCRVRESLLEHRPVLDALHVGGVGHSHEETPELSAACPAREAD